MQLAHWRLAAKRAMRGRFGGLSFYAWLVFAIALTAAVYLPGLKGPFLFDDFANLPPLGETGAIRDAQSFARYITSGTADPTGRPIALLTFLIDANNWPADPYPFKRTNLLLHLFNGALLALLLRRLGNVLYSEKPSTHVDRAALLAASLWMLHPLFTSTTLYIVQREALLPATTTLAGLLLWLTARKRLEDGRLFGACVIATAILAITAIGTLSKANGALLPLFIVVVECVISKRAQITHRARGQLMILSTIAYVPSIALATYLIYQGITNGVHGIPYRSWTIGERLLTEPRILWKYLRLLWMPTPFTSGVFNDDYALSTSIGMPWTTVPAILGLTAAAWAAWRARRRYPAASLSVLFFLAGHALESTTIPLELYFEHRNYVPALLMFWPLALWMTQSTGNPWRLPTLKIALCMVTVLTLGAMTYANASLWGDRTSQALVWARLNPESARAQVLAAQNEIERGQPKLAMKRLGRLLAQHPDQVQLALNLVSAECAQGDVSERTLQAAELSMQTALDSGSLLTSWFMRAIAVARANECNGLTLRVLDTLANAGIKNGKLPVGRRQDLIHVRGQIALAGSDEVLAATYFRQATLLKPTPALALTQAAALGSAGYPALAQEQLSLYRIHKTGSEQLPLGMPRLHAWVLEKQGYWDHEINHLEDQLQSDIITKQSQTVK